jgi:hypothetical protein
LGTEKKVRGWTEEEEEEEVVLDVFALQGIDARLKLGIPFLVPIIKHNDNPNPNPNPSSNDSLLCLQYRYMG